MKTTFTKLAVGFLTIFLANLCFSQTNSFAKLLHLNAPPAYKEAMSKLMLAEVNDYANQLPLYETLPITTNSLSELFVTSPSLAVRFGALGSLHTTNFSYGFGKGKHLCYITRMIKGTNPYDYDANKAYAIDPSALNTNAAYSMATQFLAKAFVNLSCLSTSSVVSVQPWVILHMTTSKYTVQWECNGRPVVKVVLSPPKAELWTLRVEDPSLILRKPLEITNLDFLLSQTNAPPATNAITNH
jgi:hypothetical protein